MFFLRINLRRLESNRAITGDYIFFSKIHKKRDEYFIPRVEWLYLIFFILVVKFPHPLSQISLNCVGMYIHIYILQAYVCKFYLRHAHLYWLFSVHKGDDHCGSMSLNRCPPKFNQKKAFLRQLVCHIFSKSTRALYFLTRVILTPIKVIYDLYRE